MSSGANSPKSVRAASKPGSVGASFSPNHTSPFRPVSSESLAATAGGRKVPRFSAPAPPAP